MKTIRRGWACGLFACGLWAGGCAVHEQVQYFEVVDPATDNVNYYRMTIRGHGGGGTDYQLQAGYFSAASVDVLRGQMPAMPEADLPVEQDKAFDALVDQYYAALVDSGNRMNATPGADDADVLARARLVWLGQLSPADVASMGMTGSTNPFAFRKLVFWATARNVDLREFGTQIDSMIAGATSLVRVHKAEAKARDARREGLRRFMGELLKGREELAPYQGLIDALLGTEATGGPSETAGRKP